MVSFSSHLLLSLFPITVRCPEAMEKQQRSPVRPDIILLGTEEKNPGPNEHPVPASSASIPSPDHLEAQHRWLEHQWSIQLLDLPRAMGIIPRAACLSPHQQLLCRDAA